MDEFYQDLVEPLIYSWVKNYDGVKSDPDTFAFHIKNGDIKGTIFFHPNSIVELSAKNMKTKEDVFYLHFELIDLKQALENFKTFFRFIDQSGTTEPFDLSVNKKKRILLSCTGGLTTSYFAMNMQDILDEHKFPGKVDAVSVDQIEEVIDNYDLVLLAPQVAYKLPELKGQFGNKIHAIDTMDFATQNFEKILKEAFKQ